MTQRGGKRPGAGRPKGAKDRATREAGATIAELARVHTDMAIEALVKIAKTGESESARVSAANAILDRGYGKPPQTFNDDQTVKDERPVSVLDEMSEEEAANMLVDRIMEGLAQRRKDNVVVAFHANHGRIA